MKYNTGLKWVNMLDYQKKKQKKLLNSCLAELGYCKKASKTEETDTVLSVIVALPKAFLSVISNLPV